MKKIFLLFCPLILSHLNVFAQEECKDIIYTEEGNNIIFDCCVKEVKNGNIVSYTKEGDTLNVVAVAITKDGQYIDLTKFPKSTENQKIPLKENYNLLEKGTILLGGSCSVTLNLTAPEYSTFILDPNSGYFISDKLCLGAAIPVVYMNESFAWGIAPFGRYYFAPKDSRSFFASASINLIGAANYTNFTAVIGIGNVWFITKSVGLDAEFRCGTNFQNVAVGLFLGVQVYFNDY